ncbi:Histidine kinase [Candidatus Desulfarcum epimagneticum]|uniref:histidine kinase n=1 Tax=uncultured Desulfobacteraceae bacterium TaxID=218296 RepID=A0A484HQL8_9BACT|nr:Histidine kinase [uncultured Desulfobacteraceae bacterium]
MTRKMKSDKKPLGVDVMIVDDEKGIRDASGRILSRMGFAVVTMPNGDEALKKLPETDVSMVFLDLKMPGMDGMEVLKRIKDTRPEILVIVITGYATVETAIEAMKKGAYDFITKPFEPDQLRIVANRALEKILLTEETRKLEREKERTLSDLDAEKSRMLTIVNSLPNGVVVTDTGGRVVLMNPAARGHLELDPSAGAGKEIGAYIDDEGLGALVADISRGAYVDFEDIPDYEIVISEKKYLLARGKPVLGEKRECMGAVITLIDITPIRMLDNLKTEFIEKVSHELRSPLSTIHEQLVSVLKERTDDPSAQDHYLLSRAREKTKGLISLIGDLLDISRIEDGILCHERQTVAVDTLLADIVDFLSAKSRAKDQTLTLSVPDEPLPPLNADPMGLESIFGNLITNAIHYTPEGGRVEVFIDMAGINMRVRVSDNGFGMDGRHLDRIFDKFYRVKDDNTRHITGTGLGLSIVKGLVDSLGGIIEVESAPSSGSTFTVLLPVQPDVPDPVPA